MKSDDAAERDWERILKSALKFGRISDRRRDPLCCVSCGKSWPDRRRARMCCDSSGVVIAICLDISEYHNNLIGKQAGFTASLEAELYATGSDKLEAALEAWLCEREGQNQKGSVGVEYLITRWAREYREAQMSPEELERYREKMRRLGKRVRPSRADQRARRAAREMLG